MRTILMFLMLASSIVMTFSAEKQPTFDEFLAKKKKVLVGAERAKRAAAYAANVQRISELSKHSDSHPSAAKYAVNDFALLTKDEFHKQKTGLLSRSGVAKRRLAATTKTTTTKTTTTKTTTTKTTTTKTTTTKTTTTKTTTTKTTTTKTTTTKTTTTKTTTTKTTTTKTTTPKPTTTTRTNVVSFDWSTSGKMQPIKDQGQCGSCWAFAAVALVETYYARKGNSPVSLSEQQLVDCETNSFGCNGGYPDEALTYEITNGAESESTYPYAAVDQTCSFDASSVITKIGSFSNTKSESAMLNLLQSNGPVLICLDADDIMGYSSGIILSQNCANSSINHAVVLVGYGTENGLNYWKIRNSWDTWWGEQGYFRLERNKNTCGMVMEDAYYIAS